MKRGMILIVDDDLGAEFIGEHLEEIGYCVQVLRSGNAAIHDVQCGLRYRVALVDLALPDIDGTAVIRALKKERPELPVVCLSAYDVGRYRREAIGADCCLCKPPAIGSLERMIGRLAG